MGKQNPRISEKQTRRKEDLATVSCVAIIHNGEADTGQTEVWERTTVINSNNYHQNHYLIMELARGYLNPNSSEWKSTPLQTKDLNSEDDENEDPVDEKRKNEKKRRLKKTEAQSGNKHRRSTK